MQTPPANPLRLTGHAHAFCEVTCIYDPRRIRGSAVRTCREGCGAHGWKAGTVESIWLDELHGLRISIKGHDGKWPISTIKFAEGY
jgi:hypothetical protein